MMGRSLKGRLRFFVLYTLPTKLAKIVARILGALFPEIEGIEIYLENLSALRFHMMKMFNRPIRTDNGPKKVREHLIECNGKYGDETWIYKCEGCGAVCCMCFGGAPDIRCDDCVAGDKDDERLLLPGNNAKEGGRQQVH